MYKKQLRFQKIICLLAIIVAAVWFVYSLGFITTIYDQMGTAGSIVPGAQLYKDMQPFNKQFNTYSLYVLLVSLLLLITNTQVRRKYYVSNYIATGVNVIAAVAMPIYVYPQISKFAHLYKTTVDFDMLKMWCEMKGIKFSTSTWLLDLNVVIGAISILVAIGLVVNVIWKISLMRGEKKLIDEGKEVA